MRAASPREAFEKRPPPARRIGPYQFLKNLGEGASGHVWRAREVYDEVELQQVAIKLIDVDQRSLEDEERAIEMRKRIIEEGRVLRSVEHPNVVRFHGLLIDEENEPGLVGLVMELVEGDSLAKRLKARKGEGLPMDEVLTMGAAVASALVAAHRAGIVHRDVKPDNIVLAHGMTKLIDFGIAAAGRSRKNVAEQSGVRLRLEDLDIVGKTKLSQIGSGDAIASGTVGYIDPACMDNPARQATAASDLYSLGATLFECITGRLPGARPKEEGGGPWREVLLGKAKAQSLAIVAPDVPPGLAKLVDRLLEPNPAARPRSTESVAIELERLRAERAGRKRQLPPEEQGPFRGLRRFGDGDRDVFFGRSADIAAAVDMMRGRGLVCITGVSGSGKSSLAVAGIAPVIAEGGLGGWLKGWDVCITSPGPDARVSIERALSRHVPNLSDCEPNQVAKMLMARVDDEARGTLLVLDQAEELVTVSSPESALWAAEFLAAIAEPPLPGVRVLMTARRDLLDPLLTLKPIAKILPRGLLQLLPIEQNAWGDVIDQALEAYGYEFESAELRRKVLSQINEAGLQMPLVQFAMTELWKHRDSKRKRLSDVGLELIGGVAGVLERHADATLAQIRTHAPVETIRNVLLSMTTPQGTRADKRLETLVKENGDIASEIVNRLEHARLVVKSPTGYMLAHEALLEQWGTLRDWMALMRDSRLLAADIEQDAERHAKDKDRPLLQKRRLIAAEDLVRTGIVSLSATAREFVRLSRRTEDRSKWFLRAGVLFAMLVIIASVTKYVVDTRAKEREAQANAQIARDNETRALAAEAEAKKNASTASENEKKALENEEKARLAGVENAKLADKYKNLETRILKATRAEKLRILEELEQKNRGSQPSPSSGSAGEPP